MYSDTPATYYILDVGSNEVRKEENDLFNDAFNTFYLRLYGIKHMVQDHSHRKRGNRLAARVLLHASSHRQDNTWHTTAFVTPVVEHWLEREISQCVHHEESIRRHIAPWVNVLTTDLHLDPSGQTKINNVFECIKSIFKKSKHLLNTAQRAVRNEMTTIKSIKLVCEREREMFYLMTHSTHFYLRLYGVRHMVKDHSDSDKGNPLPPHRLLLSINSKGSFICTIPQTG